ncbi:MAG: N-6 DNA methylase, partial [Proteobacteria bacterium]|nr:N-6 DNA methylase [Pseudomonadota bacterium]
DDMDAESEEFGGKRSFFAGDFARYGWTSLMRVGLGGHETLNLYAEAISRMPENPGIPLLFRDIFKNAFLPYRDPETLRAFLKIIDEFTYDHSERLGDAFEYLLSILGSQGDAGQFRTPRHIIDFIVAIIDPKKNETVLDPACGTAGFLIASYKHILKSNIDNQGASTLTPDDKKSLANNFKGYDISPDMVRLSLVNMYLHNFADPHIFEYDTLTSEERWNEYADVILANPPFMSPKGGIRPHNRFSVQSKRSEVLFVDYIAEHLTPSGRAGIIVPEGIIFQTQNAYRQLRKMLIAEYLVAVISLPAGVFKPYSGVKTSILFLDKTLARKSAYIAFFKVKNDGFDLGDQRRPIKENDLPRVHTKVVEYIQQLQAGESIDCSQPLTFVAESNVEYMTHSFQYSFGQIIEKKKILENKEYSLSGERYLEVEPQATKYKRQKIKTLVETVTPPVKIQKRAFGSTGEHPIIDQSEEEIAGWTDDQSTLIFPNKPFVIFGDHTCTVKMIEVPFAQGADGIKILKTIGVLEPKFLYHFLRASPLECGGYRRHFSMLKEKEIPLPPVEVQKEIVAEIEGYQKVISGAQAVIDNYKPHIPTDPDWSMVSIGEICNLINGRAFKPEDWQDSDSGGLPIVRIQNLNCPEKSFNYYTGVVKDKYIIDDGQLLFSWSGSRGTSFGAHIWKGSKAVLNQHIFKIEFQKSKISKMYLFHALNEAVSVVEENLHGGVGLVHITKSNFERIQIPLPSLEMQKEIVAEIEVEEALVDANYKLVEKFEKKIQSTIARIWEENTSS